MRRSLRHHQSRRPPRLPAALLLSLSLAVTSACDGPDGATSESESGSTSAAQLGPGEGDREVQWRSLTPAEEWAPTPYADDLWALERPTEIECAPQNGWTIEAGGVEVDTGACDYLSLSQPLSRPIEAGAPLRLTLWWQNLIATAPSEGHLAVVLDGHLLWEERVTIPGPADARDLELVAPIGAAEGSLITLHLHNHGANTWRFQGLYAASEAAS
jgi:hypothetical protein